MVLVGMLSCEHRALSREFWALRHAAYSKKGYDRGQDCTRGKAAAKAGSKRKLCDGCNKKLALPWPFNPALYVCDSCTKHGPARFRLISFTKAYNRGLLLSLGELWTLDQFHTSKENHGVDTPIMICRTKFRTDEVITLACDKYG